MPSLREEEEESNLMDDGENKMTWHISAESRMFLLPRVFVVETLSVSLSTAALRYDCACVCLSVCVVQCFSGEASFFCVMCSRPCVFFVRWTCTQECDL